MKRFLTLMAAIMMVITAAAQSSGIVLSYNKGKELKFFSAGRLKDAIKAAEVNDTLYFGHGIFNIGAMAQYSGNYLNVEINKPLTFIGSGAHSGGTIFKFDGEKYGPYEKYGIYLNIDSSLDDSKKVLSFEGIDFIDGNNISVTSNSSLKEMKFVNVANLSYNVASGYTIENLIIDRSQIYNLDLSSSIRHASINNTKIINDLNGSINDAYGVAYFDHCFIRWLNSSVVFVEHSLIDVCRAGMGTILKNCCYSYMYEGAETPDTKKISGEVTELDDKPSSLGYCDDNTFYGTLGGKTPFTLNPQYPTPDSSSTVKYDALNKKLTITVKRVGE